MNYERFDNIPRIAPLPSEKFVKRYADRYEPVVIRDLFAKSPIAKVKTLEDFAACVGDMRIIVWRTLPKVFERIRMTRPQVHETCTYDVGDYVAYLNAPYRAWDLVGQRYMLPRKILSLFRYPEIFKLKNEDNAMATELFMGFAGNVSPIHFDKDNRHNFFHQVVGRKFIVIIEPEQSKKIWPVFSMASTSLHDLSEKELSALIKYTGARCCLLQPGETVYFPPLYWHGLIYVDPNVSVTFRFGRSRLGKFMVDSTDYYDHRWLNLCKLIIHKDLKDPLAREIYGIVKRNAEIKFATTYEKYRHMQRVFKTLYDRHCHEAIPGMGNYDILDQLQDRAAKKELERGYTQKPVHKLIPLSDAGKACS